MTPAPPDVRRDGRDELNLTEFPFAMLASRPGKDAGNRLEFRDGNKEWVVEGSSEFGLPTAQDVEVYVILMALTREQGFPTHVSISRHDIVQRLHWPVNGHSYDRFVLALDRLVGVTIRTKHAFWDAREREWTHRKAFHILEAYDLTDSRQARSSERSLFPSWIRWSPELYQNMQAGFIKSLDVELFLSLKSSVSQALFRYLDAKRYDGKPQYRIGLRKLAFEHLGLSRNYYASQIKRKLDPAHAELISCGFLAGAEYAPMKSGEDMVIYRFPTKEPALPAPKELPQTSNPLAERLMEQGVSRRDAEVLARQAADECEIQLTYLPFRDARNPGAVLVKSIREGWAPPPAWVEAQKQQERAAKRRQKQANSREEAGQAREQEREFQSWFAGLPDEEREQYLAAARNELGRENRILADLARKHPNSPAVQAALLDLVRRAKETST